MMNLPGISRILVLCCAICQLASCASTTGSSRRNGISSNELKTRLQSVLGNSELSQAAIGIDVVSLRNGKTLFQSNSNRLFIPASNTKLITAVSALKTLGQDFRFETSIYLSEGFHVGGDTLYSDIFLKGGGDPEFYTEDLAELAHQLNRFGAQYISGDIVADDTIFDDIRLGPGWMWDDVQYDYSAQISALTINRNSVEVVVVPGNGSDTPIQSYFLPSNTFMQSEIEATTVSADTPDSLRLPLRVMRAWRKKSNVITISGQLSADADTIRAIRSVENPTLYAGTLLRDLLHDAGLTTLGSIRRGATAEDAIRVAFHESEPLPSAIAFILKDSDNLASELLIKTMGLMGEGKPGTLHSGLQITRRTMTAAGIDTLLYRQVDGSGLSTYNLISPRLLTNLLQYAYSDSEIRDPILAGLPIAGLDGTLKNRLASLALARNIRAKTGTMSGVSCLSGYANIGSDEPLAFSIMVNHYIGSSRVARQVQDDICRILTEYGSQEKLARL